MTSRHRRSNAGWPAGGVRSSLYRRWPASWLGRSIADFAWGYLIGVAFLALAKLGGTSISGREVVLGSFWIGLLGMSVNRSLAADGGTAVERSSADSSAGVWRRFVRGGLRAALGTRYPTRHPARFAMFFVAFMPPATAFAVFASWFREMESSASSSVASGAILAFVWSAVATWNSRRPFDDSSTSANDPSGADSWLHDEQGEGKK